MSTLKVTDIQHPSASTPAIELDPVDGVVFTAASFDAAAITSGTINAARLPSGYLFAGTRYYTSSGTFDKADPLGTGDIGLRAVKVHVVGAGGSGGNVSAGQGAAGGGGGGYAVKFITDLSTLSASETVTRGAGGVPQNTGGTSSFGSIVTASGGQTGGFGNPGGAGVGSSGDLNIRGNGGTPGSREENAAARPMGGAGGGSFLGGGAHGLGPAGGTNNGLNGENGGGGSGAGGGAGVAATGGTGGDGVVWVECYV